MAMENFSSDGLAALVYQLDPTLKRPLPSVLLGKICSHNPGHTVEQASVTLIVMPPYVMDAAIYTANLCGFAYSSGYGVGCGHRPLVSLSNFAGRRGLSCQNN
jgi:hypothetical protein